MQRPGNKSAAIVLALAFLLPVVYVLSAGPAFRLAKHDSISPESFERFYMPLLWSAEHSEICRWALVSYVELWLPEEPDR